VLCANAALEIKLTSEAAEDAVLLTLDGQTVFSLMKGDVVEVKKSPHRTTLLWPSKRDHFQILRTKLKWGER
jgi:NAD+ kinase